ncbi:MAG: DUF2339 domain-containing protein, partial [Oscillospiraceae bacterium]|nr:DUF2339 domain-containing protein [Oscillospiraceae bacterium]
EEARAALFEENASLRTALNSSVSELSNQVAAIERSNIFAAIKDLTARYEKLSARNEEAEKLRDELLAENSGLKTALHEQYYNEKIKLAAKRQKQLEVFFASEIAGEKSRLTALEHDIKQRVERIRAELRRNNVDIRSETSIKLTELEAEAQAKIAKARAELAEKGSLTNAEKEKFECLKNEALSDEQITELSKKNSLERLIGLNILNVVGIILIIIGVIAAGQFAYLRMGDVPRGVMLFTLGALFLTAGEIMNRRKASFFSLGITAGGIGILYAALAVSYFGMGIMNMYAALIICVAITAVAFYLSTRYNAQTLLAIALVGGYLPIISIGPERALLFSMMGYLVLLNLLALSVSFRKKWMVAMFVGFGLNIIGTIYISTLVWHIHPLTERIVETLYVVFAMIIYTAIPLIGTYAEKTSFRKSDIVLLTTNTVIGSIIVFVNIVGAGWGDYLGLTSALFAALYAAIGYIIARKFSGEKLMSALFYITGLTFFVLFVPFQFNYGEHMIFAWLAQGTSLAVYGIIKERRYVKLSGFIIGGIGLLVFLASALFLLNRLLLDWHWWGELTEATHQLQWEHLAVTASTVIIMAAFICKKAVYGVPQKAFKYCTAANLWLYIVLLPERLGLAYLSRPYWLDMGYLIIAMMCVATLILAIVYPRIRILFDNGMKIISVILGSLGVLGILLLNITSSPTIWTVSEYLTHAAGEYAGMIAVATGVLIAVGALGAFVVYDLTRRAVLEGVGGVQYLPLAVSAYIVIIFTINLIRAYGLSFSSFWISIVYVLTALLWTIIGFVKRYVLLRRFGLGLALLSVAKLFIIDLATLTQGFRILSYFILGLILVAISYVYQFFNKRLELFVSQDK